MRKILLPLSLLGTLFVAFSGCHGSRPPSGTLRVSLGTEPVTLDPARAEDGAAMRVLGNVTDGLMGYDGAGRLEARLAKSWRVSVNGLRYEFTLRGDAKWSDGKAVRAEDFVAGLRRSLSPDVHSKLAPILSAIRNVDAKDGKLVVELTKPVPYLLHALTLTLAAPVRDELLSQNGGKWSEFFPVTGPYRITEHVPESRIVLEKNPFFPEGSRISRSGRVDRVDMVIVSDESTALHLFEEGKLDIVGKVPDAEFARLKSQGKIKVDPFPAVYYLSFNLKKPPFDQVENRRAVSASIRKSELTRLLQTGEIPAASWVPSGLEGFFPNRPFAPISKAELESAKAHLSGLVARAGFDSSARNRLVMEKVQHDLLKNLRLTLSLENMDWKSYIRSLQTDAPPLFRFAWLAPFDDPIIHLRVFQTGNPNNYSHYSNPEYDKLVDEIAILQPGQRREQKLMRAQEILLAQDAAVIPLYDYVQSHLVSDRVRGFRVNPYGVIRFSDLGLENKP